MTTQSPGSSSPNPRISAQPIIPVSRPTAPCFFEMSLRSQRLSVIGSPGGGIQTAAELRLLDEVLPWLSQTPMPDHAAVCVRWRAGFIADAASLALAYQLFARYPAVVRRLRVAVDEEEVIKHRDGLLPALHRLSEDGMALILDDYGGGLSSMSMYREGLFSAVRLPPRWSARAGGHPMDDAITSNLLRLAADLGMRSIADGARDPSAVRALVDMGADYVQGLALCAPQPVMPDLFAQTAQAWVVDPAMREALAGSPPEENQYTVA